LQLASEYAQYAGTRPEENWGLDFGDFHKVWDFLFLGFYNINGFI